MRFPCSQPFFLTTSPGGSREAMTDEETEAQRDEVPRPRSHGGRVGLLKAVVCAAGSGAPLLSPGWWEAPCGCLTRSPDRVMGGGRGRQPPNGARDKGVQDETEGNPDGPAGCPSRGSAWATRAMRPFVCWGPVLSPPQVFKPLFLGRLPPCPSPVGDSAHCRPQRPGQRGRGGGEGEYVSVGGESAGGEPPGWAQELLEGRTGPIPCPPCPA